MMPVNENINTIIGQEDNCRFVTAREPGHISVEFKQVFCRPFPELPNV
jgi:hypothetical protein